MLYRGIRDRSRTSCDLRLVSGARRRDRQSRRSRLRTWLSLGAGCLLVTLLPVLAQTSSRSAEFDLEATLAKLESEHLGIQRDAARLLARQEHLPEWAATPILKALETPNQNLQCDLWQALGATGSDSLFRFQEALTPAPSPNRTPENDLRACMIKGLARLGAQSADARSLLEEYVSDPDADVGTEAARGLWLAGSSANPLILEILSGGTSEAKRRLLWMHDYLGSAPSGETLRVAFRPELLEALRSNLDDGDFQVRTWAAVIFARDNQTTERVMRTLINSADAPEEYWLVRSHVWEVLGELGEEAAAAVPALGRLLEIEGKNPVGRHLLPTRVLGKIGTPEAVVYLRKGLSVQDPRYRRQILEGITEAGPAAASTIPELTPLLADDDLLVRAQTSAALAAIGEEAIPELLAALRSKDMYARARAAEALREIGSKREDVVAAWLDALRDPYSQVRTLASLARFSLDDPEIRKAQMRISRDVQQSEATHPAERGPEVGSILSDAEVRAPHPPMGDYKFPAELERWEAFQTPAGALVTSLHRGKDRPDEVGIWAVVPEGFRLLERIRSSDGSEGSDSHFEVMESFHHSGAFFLRIKERYSGTGSFSTEHIWGIDPGFSLIPAEFEETGRLRALLEPGQELWKGPMRKFEDNNATFVYVVYNDGDGNCCSTGGKIVGSYRFAKVSGAGEQKSKWVISIDECRHIGQAPAAH